MNERAPRFWNTHDAAIDPTNADDVTPPPGPLVPGQRNPTNNEEGRPMSFADWLQVQQNAHAAFGERLAYITDWHAPTPDVEWDVAALVSHVIEEQQWVPLLLAGRTVGEARSRLAPLGSDLVVEWQRYSAAATLAWASVDPDAQVNLSYDRVPASAYLREQASDVIVHTWDLARAIGADEELGEQLVSAAWTVFASQKDTLQASGLFSSPVPMPEDAPLQSRLLALTGRDDRVAA